MTSIPTKRLIFESVEPVKESKPYLKNSIFQKIEHNYRGKSTIYRIQRKNLKNITIDPLKKNSQVFESYNDLDLF